MISMDVKKIESIEDLKKDFLDEIEKLEEALTKYISENDLNFLKTDFPDNNQKLFNNKSKEIIGKFKIETPQKPWIYDFVCSRSKASLFKCYHKFTRELKVTSKSQVKNINFDE